MKEPTLFLQSQEILESPNFCLLNHVWVEVEQNSLEKKKKTGWDGEESAKEMFEMWKKLRKRCIIEENSNGEEQKDKDDKQEDNLQLGPQDIKTIIEIEEGTNTEIEQDLEKNKEQGEIKSNNKDCEEKEIVEKINKEQNDCGVAAMKYGMWKMVKTSMRK